MSERRAGVVATAAVAAVLAACTAEGARYQPGQAAAGPNAGIIYVYRPLGNVVTRGEAPFLRVGGRSYGRMNAGSFRAINVPEGDVEVQVQQSLLMLVPTIPRSVTVTVVAGSKSYVRVNQTIDSASVGSGLAVSQSVNIEEVSSEVGQEELAQTRQND